MGQNIITRIAQLVAKAESTDSMAEADAIMAMVGRLLEAHGISLLEVGKAANDYDPVDVTREAGQFWAADNWMKKLTDAMGAYYGCRVVWTKRGNSTSVAIVGRESCRAAFVAMLPYLRGQVRRLAQRGWANHHYRTESVGRTQIGLALAYRLYVLARDRQTGQTTRAEAGMNALVPVDLVEDVLVEAFPNLRNVNLASKVRVTPTAMAAAEGISLAEQLREKGAPRLVIEKR